MIMGIYGLFIAEHAYRKYMAKVIGHLLHYTKSLIPLSLLECIFGVGRKELLKVLSEGPLFEGNAVYLGDPEEPEGGILLSSKSVLKDPSFKPYLITIKPLRVNILLVETKSLTCPRCNVPLKPIKYNWVYCEKCRFKAFYINPAKYAHYWSRLEKIEGEFSRIRGTLFEFIVVYLLRCTDFSVKGVRIELRGIGEIDIIAEKNGVIYLCECKSSYLNSSEVRKTLERLQMKVRNYRKNTHRSKVLGYLIVSNDKVKYEITKVLGTDRLEDIAILSIKDLIENSKLSTEEIEQYVNPLLDIYAM